MGGLRQARGGEGEVKGDPSGTTVPPTPTLPEKENVEVDLNTAVDETIEKLEKRAEHLKEMISKL